MENKFVSNLPLRRFLLFIATLAFSLPLQIKVLAAEVAQTLPNLPPPQDVLPPQPPPQQPPTPAPPPSPEELLPNPTPKPPEQSPVEVPTKFFVTKFEFEGSTVFKAEELLQAIEKVLFAKTVSLDARPQCLKLLRTGNNTVTELSLQVNGRYPCQKLPRTENDLAVELTFAQLLEARSAITQLYIDKGYITSGALIPEQQLPPGGGAVRIQISEGTLEDIKVIGTQRLNRSYIRSRLARARKKPLNRTRLLEALQLLQLNPRIESLSAELAAGTREGTNLLIVKVKEANTFHGQVSLNNNRSPSVGSFERSAQLLEDDLLGIGDNLSLVYANTDGSNQVNVSYTVPLTPQNTTLSFSYNTSSSNIIEKPFDVLKISYDSDDYQLTLRHPIIQTPRKELALGFTLSREQTQTFLGTFGTPEPFALSPGADSQGRTNISAVRFFQEWTQRSDFSVLALRSQFSLGVDALDATINKTGPDSRFFAWRGQGQWVRRLGRDNLLVARGDLQVADRRLVSIEQFRLGGQASVRGYRQDLLLADNGAFGSIELRLPILRIRKSQSNLQFIPFVDIGTIWNNFKPSESQPNFLASTGFGLRFQLSDRLDARFDWGIPLVSIKSNERTLQEQGLYFSVLWNPF